MTLDYYIKEGDVNGGRFYMTVTPDGEEPILLFDIHGQTHGTGNPAPKGFRSWHPMKLYTSVQTVNFLKGRGKYMEVLWDDLKIWGEKVPAAE